MKDMKTRKATRADSLAIAELTTQLGYPVDVLETEKRLAQILAKDDNAVYVALDGAGTIIGWIQAHTSCFLESGLRVEIVGLIVADKARRQGVGRILVQCVEEWTRESGAKVIVVRSNSKRIESHLFYPALGFQPTKNQQVYRKIINQMERKDI